ncbi:hypothetical protein D5085_00080 [Ectothiorhodospiraceae bacterium BW-2]|nr:hypothetical protein D5085_00080 [Ectothiorhodospiraceae bacterium BW-2]
MVSPQLKAHFAAQGVELLALDAGVEAFVAELHESVESCVEVVIGGAMDNWALKQRRQPSALSLYLSQAVLPWLSDHQIKDRVVVPAAMVVEWFLRAGQLCLGGAVELESFCVNRGITLTDFHSGRGEWYQIRLKQRGSSAI